LQTFLNYFLHERLRHINAKQARRVGKETETCEYFLDHCGVAIL